MSNNPFQATPEELDRIRSRTVDHIHRDVKQRFFNEIPEVMRLKLDFKQTDRY